MGKWDAAVLKLTCQMLNGVVEELTAVTAGQALSDFHWTWDREIETRAAVHHAAFNPGRANNQQNNIQFLV